MIRETASRRSQQLGEFGEGVRSPANGDDAWLVVASKGGAPTHPAWFVNLAKNPDKVWIEIGSRKLAVRAESLQGKAREEALARVAAVSPRYGEYQVKTDREIPVLRLTPAG